MSPAARWRALIRGSAIVMVVHAIVAFTLASRLGWDERLESLVVRELKLKKREAQRLRAE